MPTLPRPSSSLVVAAGLALGVAVTGCGGGEGPPPGLSEPALDGRSIAISSGCAACHGKNGDGGVGPPWKGLVGSEVAFVDDSVEVADVDYLTQSIMEPGARLRAGYTVKMPLNNLTATEVQKVVAYIQELR